jgi:hypothetical protein
MGRKCKRIDGVRRKGGRKKRRMSLYLKGSIAIMVARLN